MCPEMLLSLVTSQEVELELSSPRGEVHRLVEVEKSRAAAESAGRRLIHTAVEGPR
jgi:hypothetical protein